MNTQSNNNYSKMDDNIPNKMPNKMPNINIDLEAAQVSTDGEIIHPSDVTIVEEGKWDGGLCSCFNNIYPSMLCSIFTPTIYVGQNYQKITNQSNSCIGINTYIFLGNSLAYYLYYNGQIAGLYINYFMIISFLVLASKIRNMTREKYNIPGSICEDAFLTSFLTPFSIAQTARTIYKHKKICDTQETIQLG